MDNEKTEESYCQSCKKSIKCCEEYNDHYKIYQIRKILETGAELVSNGNYPLELYKETGMIQYK